MVVKIPMVEVRALVATPATVVVVVLVVTAAIEVLVMDGISSCSFVVKHP